MKIKKEHLQILQNKVNALWNLCDKKETINAYEIGLFPNAYKTIDLQKRFCFDISYTPDIHKFIRDTLYSYLTDDHIYTALKSVCPKIIRKY